MKLILAGESHGAGITGIIEGFPAGLKISHEEITRELKRRRHGFGRGPRQTFEEDEFKILSGLRGGETLGSPITFFVPHKEWKGEEVAHEMHPWQLPDPPPAPQRVPRAGHADFVGAEKFGFRDLKNVWEVASARKTVGDVLAGSLCKQFLERFGINCGSYVERVGEVGLTQAIDPAGIDFRTLDTSPLRMPDRVAEERAVKLIERARKEGESLGGAAVVVALNVPVGLGSYTTSNERLDGRLAQALMSVPSVKAVEMGEGCRQSFLPGSQAHDHFEEPHKRSSNFAGGLEGGVTNGQALQVRIVMKPLATLMKKVTSLNLDSGKKSDNWKPRADTSVVPSAAVIAEARLSWVLMEAFLENFGGVSMQTVERHFSLHSGSHTLGS